MQKIKLENSNNVAIVDDEDYEKVIRYKWYLHSQGYAHSFAIFTEQTNKTNGSVLMHRFVLNTTIGVVHHKDGNKLNNTRANLIKTTQQQNVALAAKTKHKNREIPYKGIRWNATSLKWYASICVNYKTLNLGVCKSMHEAAYTYNYALALVKKDGTFYKNVLLEELTEQVKIKLEDRVKTLLKKKGWVIL